MRDYQATLSPARRLERALWFAAHAHAGQRDLSGDPYILHPIRVMLAARAAGEGVDVQIVALLHDVLEDTEATREEIERDFGVEVATACVAIARRGKAESYLEEYLPRVLADALARRAKIHDVSDNLARPPLGTAEDEERRLKYVVALSRLETPADHAVRRGWARPPRAKVDHYFLGLTSLCHVWLSERVDHLHPEPEGARCVACVDGAKKLGLEA